MSGLKLRGRAVAVAAISAIILPVGIAAATSASAAGSPLDILGGLGSTTGSSITTAPLGIVGGVLNSTPLGSTAGGLLGSAGNPTAVLSNTLANPAGAVGTATSLVSGTPVAGLAGTATSLLPTATNLLPTATNLLPTVTNLVPTVTNLVPALTGTVGNLLPTVTNLVPSLLGPGVKAGTPATHSNHPSTAVKSAHRGEREVVVATGGLPHTGGDANATALLMCAGLAVAGAGVTLVTRRKNGLALHAAR